MAPLLSNSDLERWITQAEPGRAKPLHRQHFQKLKIPTIY